MRSASLPIPGCSKAVSVVPQVEPIAAAALAALWAVSASSATSNVCVCLASSIAGSVCRCCDANLISTPHGQVVRPRVRVLRVSGTSGVFAVTNNGYFATYGACYTVDYLD